MTPVETAIEASISENRIVTIETSTAEEYEAIVAELLASGDDVDSVEIDETEDYPTYTDIWSSDWRIHVTR